MFWRFPSVVVSIIPLVSLCRNTFNAVYMPSPLYLLAQDNVFGSPTLSLVSMHLRYFFYLSRKHTHTQNICLYIIVQYSFLGRTAASIRLNTTFRGLAPSPSSGKTDLPYNSSVPCCMVNQFCLRMGMEIVPETLYSNELTRLCSREDYIESCRRESFKTYIYIIVFLCFSRKRRDIVFIFS
jgi:hypothetical protein